MRAYPDEYPDELSAWRLPAVLEVEVTSQDISQGHPIVPCSCPVAIATARTLNAALSISMCLLGLTAESVFGAIEVDGETIIVHPPYPQGTYTVDPAGQEWIGRLDAQFRMHGRAAPPPQPIKVTLTLQAED